MQKISFKQLLWMDEGSEIYWDSVYYKSMQTSWKPFPAGCRIKAFYAFSHNWLYLECPLSWLHPLYSHTKREGGKHILLS